MRGKKHLTYTVSDFYNDYKKERKDLNVCLSRSVFIKVVKQALREIAKLIIREKFHFRLPFMMGVIRIQKKHRPSELDHCSIDFNKTKKIGKTVRHLNTHSNGDYFKWKWEKTRRTCYFTNQGFYTFRAVRDEYEREIGTRGLAAWVKKCSKDPYMKDYTALP